MSFLKLKKNFVRIIITWALSKRARVRDNRPHERLHEYIRRFEQRLLKEHRKFSVDYNHPWLSCSCRRAFFVSFSLSLALFSHEFHAFVVIFYFIIFLFNLEVINYCEKGTEPKNVVEKK